MVLVTLITMAMGGVVAAGAAHAAASCTPDFRLKNMSSGQYVSAELGYTGADYGMLRARASSVGPWELFTYCNYGSYFTLQSQANGRYVSVEVGYNGAEYAMLRARATSVGPWEKFIIQFIQYPEFKMVSNANTLYVTAELGYSGGWYGMLRARASTAGPWEKWTV